jgi:hypothetical protein
MCLEFLGAGAKQSADAFCLPCPAGTFSNFSGLHLAPSNQAHAKSMCELQKKAEEARLEPGDVQEGLRELKLVANGKENGWEGWAA